MPSPFPGMDPFIEGQIWKDFHHELISEIRHKLVPALRPKYVPRVELRVYIERAEPPRRSIGPDVFVTAESPAALRWTSQGAPAATVAEPFLVQLPDFEDVEEPYLAIYDSEDREVITIIEVLSPGNKRANSAGRRTYLQKREEILKSWANLVELDFLRGGDRMPTESPLPAGDYFALIRRSASRSQAEVYPWRLADPLPPIPMPLAPGDDDVVLALSAVFADLYDRAGYDAAVKYGRPVEPPLAPEQAQWAAEVLRSRGQ
ncbi:MAG: DUF4058 family protein [Pirellulaceae bacterium]